MSTVLICRQLLLAVYVIIGGSVTNQLATHGLFIQGALWISFSDGCVCFNTQNPMVYIVPFFFHFHSCIVYVKL